MDKFRFACVIYLFVWGCLVGMMQVTTVLTTKSMPEARFEEMMQEIDLFMTTKQVT